MTRALYLGRRLLDPAFNLAGEVIREMPVGYSDTLVILQVSETRQHSSLVSRLVPAPAEFRGLRLVCRNGVRV